MGRNRIMVKSNFEFLKDGLDTAEIAPLAIKCEKLYGQGNYTEVIANVRKIVERLAQVIIDLAYIKMKPRSNFNDYLQKIKEENLVPKDALDIFYSLKASGNSAAHTLNEYDKEVALTTLKNVYLLLAWFVTNYAPDQKELIRPFVEPILQTDYATFGRKLIYIQTVKNLADWPAYQGSEKIGEATIVEQEVNQQANSEDLRAAAQKRINQYMKTAGVTPSLEWAELAYSRKEKRFFSDKEVHQVLKRSGIKKNPKLAGDEWFLVSLDTAKAAIKAVKEGRKSLKVDELPQVAQPKIKLRPEQAQAVKQTRKVFKTKDTMLWNAKMRFGKTLTALKLIKEEQFQKVLIMTHRPVVKDSWFDDFNKMEMGPAGYIYGSKTKGEAIENLALTTKPFIYFASIQDLRGSKVFGGKKDKNEVFTMIDWDLVIIDEAHEGTQTPLAQSVISGVKKDHTKLLGLSGTPFNILDQYEEEQVYTWDYVMEQEAKYKWEETNPQKPNPYASLPKVSMYTFDIGEQFKAINYRDLLDKSFNFKEFFRVDKDGKFIHEADVKQFLVNITSPNSKNNYPFSTKEFRNNLRHTLWILPGVKEANALETLLKANPVFMDYEVINVVKNDQSDNVQDAKESDLESVRSAIGPNPAQTKTITLTVRKLTTGVNVPEWTGVVFLSNTNSATQYLQAAFRAQTPFIDEHLGRKEECYIFDFAPDRALTVMAESTRLNTGVGKRTSNVQKEQMKKLLNFMPIIGKSGNQMKRFEVDTLLAKIKRVYAQKAVQSGFDDDSLYSDELLMLDQVDLKEFNDLKAIVGTTKKEKTPTKIDINKQGLTDEEYDRAEKAKKKPAKKRTPEEIAALEKMNELKKQRKTMISVLRSISIRIPLLIYGMDIDINENVNMKKFVKLVDDVSWQEFMPNKVTKELFMKFAKYYDQDVFIEAGRIIRHKVKRLDKLDPIARASELALIFGTFRNPDKETVLTPWRVVNLQLGETLGGYSFYDDKYQATTTDGKDAAHWIKTNYTDELFGPNSQSKILEINSKTGLYPLYAAISLYYQRFQVMNEQAGGKFSSEDELFIWQQVLRENIFVIAKTPMAKHITQRTLAGYQDMETNIEYIEDIVNKSKASVSQAAKEVRSKFNDMKFDVVIGNPPYQEVVAKKETDNGQRRVTNIFQNFQELADQLNPKYTNLIYPGKRWLHRSGKGMEKFGLDQINDPHLSQVIFYPNSTDIFTGVAIDGGITIVLKDMSKKDNGFEYVYSENGIEQRTHINSPGKRLIMLNPNDEEISIKIEKFVRENNLDYISNSNTINQKLFRIESDFAEKNPDKVELLTAENKKNIDYTQKIKLFTNDKAGKAGRATWFIADKEVITVNKEILNQWKVIVSSANAGGQKRDNQIEILDNHSAFGRSRIALKAFDTRKEAENFFDYANSYIVRYTFLLTDENLTSLGKKVPDFLDYTDDNNFIDYSENIDNQLQKLFGISTTQMEYIKKRVSSLRNKK